MSRTLSIVLPDEIYQQLEESAKEKSAPKGQVIRESLLMYFKQLEFEKSIKNGQLPQFLDDLKKMIDESKVK